MQGRLSGLQRLGLRILQLNHPQEDVVHGGDVDAAAVHAQRLLVCLEAIEEPGQVGGVLRGNGELDLIGGLILQLRLGQVLLDHGGEGGGLEDVRLLRDSQVVAAGVDALEEDRRAAAGDAAAGHDGDAVAEHVRLLHPVGGEHDQAFLANGEQKVPNAAASFRVEAAKNKKGLNSNQNQNQNKNKTPTSSAHPK